MLCSATTGGRLTNKTQIKAGERWIDLVKGEWNSTMTLDLNDFPEGDVETRLFYGEYEINQLDESGNIIASNEFTMQSNSICSFEQGSTDHSVQIVRFFLL